MVWNIVKVRAAIRTHDIGQSSNRAVDLYTNIMLPDGSVGEEFHRQRSGSQQFDHFAEHSLLFPSRGDDDFSGVEPSRAINGAREPVVHPAGSPNTHSRDSLYSEAHDFGRRTRKVPRPAVSSAVACATLSKDGRARRRDIRARRRSRSSSTITRPTYPMRPRHDTKQIPTLTPNAVW